MLNCIIHRAGSLPVEGGEGIDPWGCNYVRKKEWDAGWCNCAPRGDVCKLIVASDNHLAARFTLARGNLVIEVVADDSCKHNINDFHFHVSTSLTVSDLDAVSILTGFTWFNIEKNTEQFQWFVWQWGGLCSRSLNYSNIEKSSRISRFIVIKRHQTLKLNLFPLVVL